MWFNQDLLEEFQYNNITESDLQGASDLILNSSLSYNSKTEKEFNATLTGNYSSDKVFALGSPEDFSNSDVLYNDEIIEKGFFTLDFVLSKMLTKKLQIKLVCRNLLNPDIQQTQLIRDINTGVAHGHIPHTLPWGPTDTHTDASSDRGQVCTSAQRALQTQ